MNMLAVCFCLIALMASSAQSVDMTLWPPAFSARDSIAVWMQLQITSTGSNLKRLAFVAIPDSGSIGITYTGGASNCYIGSIAPSATGYGSFQLVGPSGNYNLAFNITYKIEDAWYNYNKSFPLDITEDDKRSEGKQILSLTIDDKGDVAAVQLRSEEVTLGPSSYEAESNVPIWQRLVVSAGDSDLEDVSYLIKPDNALVSVQYPPFGNVVGSVAAQSSVSASYQLVGPAGSYSVNASISYKKDSVSYKYWQIIPLQISA